MSECSEIRPRLTAFLDGEVEDSDAIRVHLDSCPECVKLLDTHKKVTRLSALVRGPSPHPEAWTRIETRLSTFSGGRLFAFVPAAAAAILVLMLFVVFSPWGGTHEPVGFLTGRIGLVRIRPFAEKDWIIPGEKRGIYKGDRIQTGADSAARLELADGGCIVLDKSTELHIGRSETAMLRVALLCGRTCTCGSDSLCIENEGAEMEVRGCQCIVTTEDGNPVVYVKSGSLNCRIGGLSTEVGAMQKLILDGGKNLSPLSIEDPKIFEWADKLLARAEAE